MPWLRLSPGGDWVKKETFSVWLMGILVLYKVGERETALPRFGQCGVEGRHRLQDRQMGLLNA